MQFKTYKKYKVTFFSPWEINAAGVRNMKHLPKKLIEILKIRKVEIFDAEDIVELVDVKNVQVF